MLLVLDKEDVFVVNGDGTGKINMTNTPFISETSPFWVNLSSLLELKPNEIKEIYPSDYTYCTWGQESSDFYREYQCSCTASSCECILDVYESKNKKRHIVSWKINEKRTDVPKNAVCQ